MLGPVCTIIALAALFYAPTAWELREIRREYMRIEAYEPGYWTQY